MLLSKVVESRDGVSERAGIADVLPGQSSQTGCDGNISMSKGLFVGKTYCRVE